MDTLEHQLLSLKINDYRLAITGFPESTGRFGKMFAATLGRSSGEIAHAYEALYGGLARGDAHEAVEHTVRRVVNDGSKVSMPLFGEGRLCGLVALNHSGFFEAETALYSALMPHLAGATDLAAAAEGAARADSSLYRSLLANKQDAIDRFSVLMGITGDADAVTAHTAEMPSRLQNYFSKVAQSHRGGSIRPVWPLSFRSFADAIEHGLLMDSVSAAVQRGVGEDYGFIDPVSKEAQYQQIISQIKELVALPKGEKLVPAHAHYLSALAFAAPLTADAKPEFPAEKVLLASTTAYCCVGTDKKGRVDPSDFATKWWTTFTTI